MSDTDAALHSRIAAIDSQRSRLGLIALVSALVAIALVASGIAVDGPWRIVAYALLVAGGLCVFARLRLAWQRVGLMRELAQRDAKRELASGDGR